MNSEDYLIEKTSKTSILSVQSLFHGMSIYTENTTMHVSISNTQVNVVITQNGCKREKAGMFWKLLAILCEVLAKFLVFRHY